MAQLDFYALKADLELVFKFIFDETDCRVFESYSRPGHDLREFYSLESLLESDFLDANHGRYSLRFLSRSVNCEPIFREITLRKTGQKRYEVHAPPMFQIIEGERFQNKGGALKWSEYSHWNEAGAKQRSYYDPGLLNAVDWKVVRRVSGKIYRHIKNHLAVAKIHTFPVLPGVLREMENGLSIWTYPDVVDRSSDLLEIL